MFQRIQTLWTLLAACCGFLTFKFSFYSGNLPANGATGPTFKHLSASTSLLIFVLTVALVSGLIIDIFLYKNRKLQLRLLLIGIAVSLLNIFLYYQQTQQYAEGTYAFTALFTLAIPILLVLAARGVYRDEKLVKSADRLR